MPEVSSRPRMGFKEVMAKIGHLGLPGDPPLWEDMSVGKKILVCVQIPMFLLTILGILIFVLDLSGL